MRKASRLLAAWKHGLLATLALASVAAQADPGGFRVTSFHQGLVRIDAGRRPHLYAEGDSFPYSPNDTCLAMVGGHMVSAPCMRHGFELTYESMAPDSVMDCTTESSRGRTPVAPWRVHLPGPTGSYSKSRSWSVEGTADPSVQEVVTCRVDGQEVLKHAFAITVPRS